VRRATLDDLPDLVRHRRRMFEEMGDVPRANLDRADPIFRRWARREYRAHRFVPFVAENGEGLLLGSGALWLAAQHPRPRWPGLVRLPYLMSMYTEPPYRRRGVGTRVVEAVIDWARTRGYPRVYLYATPLGRPVYERLGFVAGPEMRLDLASDPARPHRVGRGSPKDPGEYRPRGR
jgi:GNAT superfamily N-acetyltransferase